MKFINTFELSDAIKRKGNKGRLLFVQKITECVGKPGSYMLKHFYDEEQPQLFKVTNKNHKNWVIPFSAERFEPLV